MRHITVSGRDNARHAATTAFWIVAGIIAVIALGDALALLAVAVAMVTTARWIYREVEHRSERNDAEIAPVTHLRPAFNAQRDLKKTSARASWLGAA